MPSISWWFPFAPYPSLSQPQTNPLPNSDTKPTEAKATGISEASLVPKPILGSRPPSLGLDGALVVLGPGGLEVESPGRFSTRHQDHQDRLAKTVLRIRALQCRGLGMLTRSLKISAVMPESAGTHLHSTGCRGAGTPKKGVQVSSCQYSEKNQKMIAGCKFNIQRARERLPRWQLAT